MTLAAQGCIVFTPHETVQVPGLNVAVVDVTGAGDTFCSSFLYARSQGHDIAAAAAFANAAAAICVAGLGARAGAVAPDVVMQRMQGFVV